MAQHKEVFDPRPHEVQPGVEIIEGKTKYLKGIQDEFESQVGEVLDSSPEDQIPYGALAEIMVG